MKQLISLSKKGNLAYLTEEDQEEAKFNKKQTIVFNQLSFKQTQQSKQQILALKNHRNQFMNMMDDDEFIFQPKFFQNNNSNQFNKLNSLTLTQSEHNLKSKEDDYDDLPLDLKESDRPTNKKGINNKKSKMKDYIDTILDHERMEEDSFDLKQKNQVSDDEMQEDKDQEQEILNTQLWRKLKGKHLKIRIRKEMVLIDHNKENVLPEKGRHLREEELHQHMQELKDRHFDIDYLSKYQ